MAASLTVSQGMQVSPTELENFLLRHPQVESAVVVPVPDDDAGELPMAFIVKSKTAAGKGLDDEILKLKLHAQVNSSFAPQKRLAGGIEFVEAIPKTGSGKVQRKVLKSWARDIVEERRAPVAQIPNVAVFNFDSDDELIDDY
jgi:acyl-coenzyme A synthetase/AMP-(fatty) acid ligase